MRHRIFTVVAFAVAITMIPTAALAHVVYKDDTVWDDPQVFPGKCLDSYAEISHGSGGGYTKGDSQAVKEIKYPWGQVDCIYEWDRPKGTLAVKTTLWKLQNGNEWVPCKALNWKYNAVTDWQVIQTKNWGTTPPCGKGIYYGTITDSAIKLSGVWRGGPLWSGSHYL